MPGDQVVPRKRRRNTRRRRTTRRNVPEAVVPEVADAVIPPANLQLENTNPQIAIENNQPNVGDAPLNNFQPENDNQLVVEYDMPLPISPQPQPQPQPQPPPQPPPEEPLQNIANQDENVVDFPLDLEQVAHDPAQRLSEADAIARPQEMIRNDSVPIAVVSVQSSINPDSRPPRNFGQRLMSLGRLRRRSNVLARSNFLENRENLDVADQQPTNFGNNVPHPLLSPWVRNN